jgi:hypothetical protein
VLRQDSNHWERDFKEAKDRVGNRVKKKEKIKACIFHSFN